jgi:hypothetical protein
MSTREQLERTDFCRPTGRDHLVQPQLAEPEGRRRPRLPREPGSRRASALLGYMAGPNELGIEWNPERFDISI